MVIAGIVMHRFKLPRGEADLVPSNHWPEPLIAAPVEQDRGPVLILIEYRIDPAEREPFLHALNRFSHQRRRDGAYNWGITEDVADPAAIIEWFFVESWAEHLRQHKRVSHSDADLQSNVVRYHVGPGKPEIRHLLAASPSARGRRYRDDVGTPGT